MMGRIRALLCLTACAVAVAGAPATAGGSSVSVTATTMLAEATLPDATVDAAWAVRNGRDVVTLTGDNLPAAVTTVRATWQGTRRVDGTGRVLRIEHKYVYDAVREGATYSVRVSFRVAGRWDYIAPFERPYGGSMADTYRSFVTEQMTIKVPEVAGKTLPVRLDLMIRYPEACASGKTLPVRLDLMIRYPEACARIDDAFTVLP